MKTEAVSENDPTLHVTKMVPLFSQPSEEAEESFSELNEACYNFCFCIVTSNGFLLSVVFDSDGSFVNEACGILETCSSRKFKFSQAKEENKISGMEKEGDVIQRAVFHWDRNGRYVTYLASDGQVKIVKYRFQLLDTSFSCSGKCNFLFLFLSHDVSISGSILPSSSVVYAPPPLQLGLFYSSRSIAHMV